VSAIMSPKVYFFKMVLLGSILCLRTVVVGFSITSTSSPPCGNVVLYGSTARELLFLTAKLAARAGLETSYICAPGSEEVGRRLMYGDNANVDDDNDDGIEDGRTKGLARPISSGEDIMAALQATNSIIFLGYDQPIDESSYKTLLNSAGDKLTKVVLMSKMGVSRAKGGGGFMFGGGGGGDAKLLQSETDLRNLCRTKNLDFSIIRAGNLKGGGPGDDVGNGFGLDGCYYNTLLDIVEASVTMAHDRYTLGLDCRVGDTIDMPNMFAQMGSKSSFEACPYDTNRIVIAGGLVAAALYDKPVEVTVSAQKGQVPPTLDAWKEAFSILS